jgi:hypothetical protein
MYNVLFLVTFCLAALGVAWITNVLVGVMMGERGRETPEGYGLRLSSGSSLFWNSASSAECSISWA